MDRINGANYVDLGGGRRGFRNQNKLAGEAGTVVTAEWLNDLQEEIAAVIETPGMALNGGSTAQLYQMLAFGNIGAAAIGVKDFQNAPPGAPVLGDRYLVKVGSGAWAGYDNHVAAFMNGGWLFFPPRSGQMVSYWTGTMLVTLFWSGAAWVNLFRDTLGRALRPTITAFAASGTWMVPANLVFAKVSLVGGGGGGGLSTNNVAGNRYGGGGGNGGYGSAIFRPSSLGASVAITVGAGGSGRLVASGAGGGTAGGFSAFGGLVQANGGAPGAGGGGVDGNGGIGGTVSFAQFATQGTRGADGFELAGVTFPTPMGDNGRGGQGGYSNTGTGSSANANDGLPGLVLIEEYVL